MLWQGIWLKMLRQIPPHTHTHASLRRYSLCSWNGSLKTPGSEDWHKMASSLFTRSQNQAAPHTESRIVCVCHARRYEHINYPWLKRPACACFNPSAEGGWQRRHSAQQLIGRLQWDIYASDHISWNPHWTQAQQFNAALTGLTLNEQNPHTFPAGWKQGARWNLAFLN